MTFSPDYSIRKLDKGWGVYLSVDASINEILIVFTEATWIGTFSTQALAEQYVEFMERLNDQR